MKPITHELLVEWQDKAADLISAEQRAIELGDESGDGEVHLGLEPHDDGGLFSLRVGAHYASLVLSHWEVTELRQVDVINLYLDLLRDASATEFTLEPL